MRVGIDFDNTLVRYDDLFHRVAREVAGIPADLPANKVVVRDYLRGIGREEVWTEMQGLVYGARMAEAAAYAGVLDVLAWARAAGLVLFIISHKTRVPFRGPAYDLHAAARAWTRAVLADAGGPLVPDERVFFEPTKADKLRRIAACGCDVFIDDLPEILLAEDFPRQSTVPLLFDPEANHAVDGIAAVTDWPSIRRFLEDRWPSLG